MNDKDPNRLPHITNGEAEALLRVAGITWTWVEELSNRYWPIAYAPLPPWFLFNTNIGLLIIGRRKRVIEIDWRRTDLRVIVTDDDVTKSETCVHAYSLVKAAEYLGNLAQHAALEKV